MMPRPDVEIANVMLLEKAPNPIPTEKALRELMKALGIGSEKANDLFRAGVRSAGDLGGRSVDDILKAKEPAVLYLCPECGAFVSSADRVCGRCGAQLAEEAMDLERFLEAGGPKECPAGGGGDPAEAGGCPPGRGPIRTGGAGPGAPADPGRRLWGGM